MHGRIKLIKDLINMGVWNNNKEHHLLGCALPQEIGYAGNIYKDINIASVDTSNPVVSGLCGIRYTNTGLNDKNTTLLADLINADPDDETIRLISYNIHKYKQINRI